MSHAGIIRELWRYPVKSMGGERLEAADLDRAGVVGDRLWALRSEREGVITSGKKLPKLMLCTARFLAPPPRSAGPDPVPHVAILLPDGQELRSDDPGVHAALSVFLGQEVTLCARRPRSDRAHYRAGRTSRAGIRQTFGVGPKDPLPDFSMLPLSLLLELSRYATPRGVYHDAYPLHLLTTSTLATLRAHAPAADFDVRRFRPSALIETEGDGLVENTWCGGTLSAGGARIAVEVATVRCSMPSRVQPGLPGDPTIIKTIVSEARRCAGVYARVRTPGRVQVGDRVDVAAPAPSPARDLARAGIARAKRLLVRAVAAALPAR
jgi:uncharacterized protein